MIDNMCARIFDFEYYEWKRFRKSIDEENYAINRSGSIEYLDWGNLRVVYYPISKQLKIMNSIHKFFNFFVREIPISGCNYNDFTFDNLKETFEFISYHFNRGLKDFNLIGKIEYGVNVIVSPFSPMDIIESYISISNKGTNIFHPMTPKEGRVYGKKAYFTDYNFKAYDKSKQAQMQLKGVMRIECQCKVPRIKNLLKIKGEITFNDLTKEKYINFFKQDFLTSYNNIMKVPLSQDLCREDLKEILMISTPVGKAYDNLNFSKYHYRENRKKYKSIMKKYSDEPDNAHYLVKREIQKKIEILTS